MCLHEWKNVVELHLQDDHSEARVLHCLSCRRHLLARVEAPTATYPEAVYDPNWFAGAGHIEYVASREYSRFKSNNRFCKYLRQPMTDTFRLPLPSDRDFVYYSEDYETELYRPGS
jgi:hypothetical protein